MSNKQVVITSDKEPKGKPPKRGNVLKTAMSIIDKCGSCHYYNRYFAGHSTEPDGWCKHECRQVRATEEKCLYWMEKK